MRKLLYAVMFLLSAGFCCALEPAAHVTVKEDMRIFLKERQEVIVNFPSNYLNNSVRISVFFPKGYEDSGGRYASVYLISGETLPADKIFSFFSGQKTAEEAVFVYVQTKGEEKTSALGDFIVRELFPYIGLNYKVDTDEAKKVVAGAGAAAASVLEILAKNSGNFSKAALLFSDTTPMPAVGTSFDKSVAIWAAGRIGNMARLQQILEDSGLKYMENFAYKILPAAKDEPQWRELKLDYLFAAPDSFKISVFKSADRVSLRDMTPLNMRLDIKTKEGWDMNYIPRDIKIAPPFLTWDADNAEFNVISGAETGNVKITMPLSFYKNIKTDIKITK